MRKAPARVSAAALGVQEELRAMPTVEVGAPPGHIAAHGRDGLATQRHQALLVALPDAADDALLEIDAPTLEADRLAHAQAGSIEKLEQSPVAQRPRAHAVRRLDQALDLAWSERARQLLAPPGQRDVGRGIVLAHAEDDQVTVERARGRGLPGDRAGGKPALPEVGEPALHLVRRRGRG